MNLSLNIIFIMIAVVGVYDIVVIVKKGKQYSVSASLILASKKFPMIVATLMLIVGIVIGHVFWRMNANDINPNVKCFDVSVTPMKEVDYL